MLHTCAGCSAAYAVGLKACPECGATERRPEGGSVLPQIQVACDIDFCRLYGQVKTVRLPSLGVNLVYLPTLLCAMCGGQVKTIKPWLPAPEGAAEGDTDMPKITRHGGPSNDTPVEPDTVPMEPGTGQPVGEPAADGPAEDDPEGGEEPSPGSSSETSSEKPETSPETSKAAPRKRARTTASPSKRARTGSSSAPGTGGDQTDPTSETN